MSVDLVAKKTVRYGGRVFKHGQSFTVRSASDATVLCAVGLARRGTVESAVATASAPEAKKRGRPRKMSAPAVEVPEPAAVDAVPVVDEPSEPEPILYAHQYQRRDMTAEGE